ncbi:PepSY domain-containing protein [Shewanella sp. OMA3-2]|uniref:PepSY domain-containing protein n=1 Tax=Shewanella sp. OMA3-2 TaxID=2908650 RepID=UPI001F409D0F|nr:hypothetical protein [Shewanella sp. OMA3-2]UJF21746.1 hypothetical protein L0B17_17115 [Shewanella sp. OMA3-2]
MSMFITIGLFSLSTLNANFNSAQTLYEADHNHVQKLVSAGHIRSLDECLNWLAQYCDVQLVDAQLFQEKDKWRYNLQLKLKQGHTVNLQFDAQSGTLNSLTQLPSECTQHETATR